LYELEDFPDDEETPVDGTDMLGKKIDDEEETGGSA